MAGTSCINSAVFVKVFGALGETEHDEKRQREGFLKWGEFQREFEGCADEKGQGEKERAGSEPGLGP